MKLRLTVLPSIVLLASFLTPGALFAQSAGGSLRGRASDEAGVAMPGVTMTALETLTGVAHVAATANDGVYRFPSLPVGDYEVKAELAGFSTVLTTGVHLNVATERTLDVTLPATTVEEQITVTADAPLVDDGASIGTVISREELDNLPLNGRHYAGLGSLARGTTSLFQSDPTKPGELTIGLNGGNGRNVSYLLDGGDNSDDIIGGALQSLDLDAVGEFRIQTQQYEAQYGRSSGGVVTVVTRSGTNEIAGSVYGYFRDDSLNSQSESEEKAHADKRSYERQQYGGTIGGPIVRDRAHFFAAWEKSDTGTEYIVQSGGIEPSLDGKAFALPFDEELATAKATVSLSPAQFFQLRYAWQKNDDKYGANSLSSPDSLATISSESDSILAGHSWQISSMTVNEALIQYSSFENAVTADSSNPSVTYPSGYQTGRNTQTPQSQQQRKTQFKDELSWSMTIGDRRHDMKAGLNYVDESLEGDFSAGAAPEYAALEDRAGSPIQAIYEFSGFSGFDTPVEQYSVFVQDDLYVSDRLTVNAGLRYDYWSGFDLDQRSNELWQTLSTQTKYDEYYLRDFQGGRGGQLENDDDNWGPRIAFTWDLKGDARSFVRGGWGIYYDFPYTNSTILFPDLAVRSNYGISYISVNPSGILNADGSYFQPGDPLPPNDIPDGYVPPPNEVASPTLATPKATQMSLGYSTEIGGWLGLTLDLVSIRYRDIPYRFRANARLDADGNPQAISRFPEFGNFRIWMGDGEADYDGVNLGVRARFTNKLEVQGFYTYSEADGNVLAGADEFEITDTLHQPDWSSARDASVDPLNPKCDACFGPLNTDARHRVTLSALYRAPWDMTIAGVVRYRSALPYTRINTGVDTNGNGTPDDFDLNDDGFNQDLQPGVAHVNDSRGASFSQFDLRLGKLFRLREDLGIELMGEIYNVFDSDNPGRFTRTGTPTAWAGDPQMGEQRLVQLGAKVTF